MAWEAADGEAADGETALTMCRAVRPQLVLLDQRMPAATGLETAERILAEDPTQMIVLFSAFLDRETVGAAKRIGVYSCLSTRDVRDLPDALRALPAARSADTN